MEDTWEYEENGVDYDLIKKLYKLVEEDLCQKKNLNNQISILEWIIQVNPVETQ